MNNIQFYNKNTISLICFFFHYYQIFLKKYFLSDPTIKKTKNKIRIHNHSVVNIPTALWQSSSEILYEDIIHVFYITCTFLPSRYNSTPWEQFAKITLFLELSWRRFTFDGVTFDYILLRKINMDAKTSETCFFLLTFPLEILESCLGVCILYVFTLRHHKCKWK